MPAISEDEKTIRVQEIVSIIQQGVSRYVNLATPTNTPIKTPAEMWREVAERICESMNKPPEEGPVTEIKLICTGCGEHLIGSIRVQLKHKLFLNVEPCRICSTPWRNGPVKDPDPRFVQARNPLTERFVKIDRKIGHIVTHKKSFGPYKNIPIIGSEDREEAL